MARCASRIYLLLFAIVTVCAREVAITIDDLPRGGDAQGTLPANREMTIKLLAPFQQGHIPLIGFVNECHHAEELRSLLSLWVAAGSDLGNHTCSHIDLNNTPVSDFESEIMKGQVATSVALGHRPVYFRYPFLHVGKDADTKRAIEDFLAVHQYKNAPVTLDNFDYMFAAFYAKALAADRVSEAQHVREAYMAYMRSIFAFFEQRSIQVTGHESARFFCFMQVSSMQMRCRNSSQ